MNTLSYSPSPSRPSWPGIAGALYVPQVGIINPGEFEPGNSIEVVIWAAVGGRGHPRWPDHRRHRRQPRKILVHQRLPEFWLFALGALFVLVTLFLPKGLVGLWKQLFGSRRSAPVVTSTPVQSADIERGEDPATFDNPQPRPAE